MLRPFLGTGAGRAGLALEGIDLVQHLPGIQVKGIYIFLVSRDDAQRGAGKQRVGGDVGQAAQVAAGIGNDLKHNRLLLVLKIKLSNLLNYYIRFSK